MIPFSFQPWSMMGFSAHWIFGIMAIVGVVLFVAWGLKQREDALKTLMIWALVIGVLGLLLTSQFGFMSWGGNPMMNGMMGGGGNPMMNMMMNGMMGKQGMMGPGAARGIMDQKTINEMMGTDGTSTQNNTTQDQQ